MKFLRNLITATWAIFTIGFLIVSTSIFFIPILFLGLIKLVPILRVRLVCARYIDCIIHAWIDINSFYLKSIRKTKIRLQGVEKLDKNKWYLVVANHQSWLDIVILQYLFNRKIPMLKFFIKDQLKWIPLMGFAWWAMGSPFMKRYTKEYLAKYPHKKGRDLEATRKAFSLLDRMPCTIMNFIEGTRFTPQKKDLQQSPYAHLLKPKAGGLALVIQTMGKHIDSFLDVSIVYPNPSCSLWDFLCGRVKEVYIHVREVEIPPQFKQQAFSSAQSHFHDWLNQTWSEKDEIIKKLRQQYALNTIPPSHMSA